MLIQTTNSATSAPAFTSDSAPAPAAAAQTMPTPAGQQQTAVKTAAQQMAVAPTPAQIQSAVDNINRAMRQSNADVEFSIDKDTNQTVIKVIETTTGQVIRQFPSEEVLSIARSIDHMQQRGLLLKQEA